MRICLMSAEYPPETGGGGIGTYVYHLAHGLAGKGHSVHVVSKAVNDRERHYRDAAVEVHRLPTVHFPAPAVLQDQGGVKDIVERAFTVARFVRKLNRTEQFEMVEAPNWGSEACVYALRRSTSLVVRCSTGLATVGDLEHVNGLSHRLRRGLEGIAPRHATCLITHGAFMRAGVARAYGVSASRIHIVPLGIPIPAEPAGTRSTLPGVRPTVLFAGRLEARKGIQYLLDAIPQVVQAVPNVEFRIVGKHRDDTADRFLEASPSAVREATTFLGYVDRGGLEAEYARCGVFAAPSLYESFGLVHIEAMARSRPVVACNVAATPEVVVDGETGLLVPPRDSAALAHALIRLLTDLELAQRMGVQARAWVKAHFSTERFVEQTLGVYRQVAPKASWARRRALS
jgi:glycogen(starch) synthase